MTTGLSDTHRTEEAEEPQCPTHSTGPVPTAALLPVSNCCYQLVPLCLHGMRSHQCGMSLQLQRNQKVKVAAATAMAKLGQKVQYILDFKLMQLSKYHMGMDRH